MTLALTLLFLVLILIGGPQVWAACILGGGALYIVAAVIGAILGPLK